MSNVEVPDERENVIAEMRPRLVTFFRLRASEPEDLAQETIMRALAKVRDPRTRITVPLPGLSMGLPGMSGWNRCAADGKLPWTRRTPK